jgi:hypothetical protein
VNNQVSKKFKSNYGKVQGIDTEAGSLTFDKSKNEEKVSLEHKLGWLLEFSKDKLYIKVNSSEVTLEKTGKITINGTEINLTGNTKVNINGTAGVAVNAGGLLKIDDFSYLTHVHLCAAAGSNSGPVIPMP